MTDKKILIKSFSLIAFILTLYSCNPVKYLSEDEYLLSKYKIENKGSNIPDSEYKNYIKQKPNKKILGWKLWLTVYNLSGKNNDKWYNRYLKEIGESPVAYNEDLVANTSQQLEMYLSNKGFFNSEVSDTTIIKNRKATVIYTIHPGKPYTIRNIDYLFEDLSLAKYLMSDSISPVLVAGEQYDTDKFQAERARISNILREKGYFNFSIDYVKYSADSTVGDHQVDIVLRIKNYERTNAAGKVQSLPHPRYKIRNVYLKVVSNGSGIRPFENTSYTDTVNFDNIYVISEPGVRIRSELITQKNYIIPGDFYNARREQQTYRNLTSLSAFRLVDYKFTEIPGDEYLLDCDILMLPAVRQAFTGGIEGTTSGGNIGAAGNINYQNRNLFGGSEKFDLTFLGAIETLPPNQDVSNYELGTLQELGVEAKLNLPQFLLPFKTDQFIRKYNPETNINLAYNYQKRPDYTRSTFRGSFGYRWRGNRYLTHAIYPIDISLINTPFLDDKFRNWLEGTYLYYSYLPHFITDQRYRLVYTNQKLNKTSDFQYLRFGIETAGNLMYGIYQLFGSPKKEAFQLFGVDYAQYFRSEIDFRHYDYLGGQNSMVYRGYMGAAVPYLNSSAIPFEKQFFGGGANSIRAWRVKNLGPGSFAGDTISKYPNQTADLKIEANIEYRFKLIWKIDGALFIDAGNIWSLSDEDDRVGAIFDLSRFYREFAVGTGFGMRFDFNFFVFRIDIGIPLVDPSFPEGKRWVPTNADLKWNDLGYNFAIGYPF